jgi:hypothetical protein
MRRSAQPRCVGPPQLPPRRPKMRLCCRFPGNIYLHHRALHRRLVGVQTLLVNCVWEIMWDPQLLPLHRQPLVLAHPLVRSLFSLNIGFDIVCLSFLGLGRTDSHRQNLALQLESSCFQLNVYIYDIKNSRCRN